MKRGAVIPLQLLEIVNGTETDFLVFTQTICPYCTRAFRTLDAKGLTYTDVNLDHFDGLRQEVVSETGHRTVPVVFDLSFRNTEIAFCNFCLSAVSNISCLAKSGCNFSSKNCSFVNFRKVSEYFCSPNRWSHLVDEKREREKRKETMRHAR